MKKHEGWLAGWADPRTPFLRDACEKTINLACASRPTPRVSAAGHIPPSQPSAVTPPRAYTPRKAPSRTNHFTDDLAQISFRSHRHNNLLPAFTDMSYQCRDPVSGRVTTFVYNKEWVSGAGAGAGAGRVPVGKPASSLGTALQRALFVHGDPAQVFTDESQTSLLGPTELKKKLKCLGRTEKQTQAGGNPYLAFCADLRHRCRHIERF